MRYNDSSNAFNNIKKILEKIRSEIVSQIYNVRLFPYFARGKKGDMPLSILPARMNSETKKRRDSLGDTPDTPLLEEQMEVPSSFDESLVRNGRLHWTPYRRRRAREIYETAGIVRHVTETKKKKRKRETIRPFPRLRLFRVTMIGESTMQKPIVKKSYILSEIKRKKLILRSGNIRVRCNDEKSRDESREKFSNRENNKPRYLNTVYVRAF